MSIALDQVTKTYQSVPVVNDVSLSVAEGEFLVLLGPSGSGKSTLLRAIAGLTTIDRGRVSLYGRDVTGVPARKREVGFVFQHYALFRNMTVGANIEFALRVRGVRASERRARRRELLRLVALEGMDERLPSELSGGQQQRVAVARALAHRPKVLLMDEPFGALDAKIREELRRTVRQIQRELGVAAILVTHDQEEAFALADRIGVMHQGRLLECGPPDELYGRPATRFVAGFLGAANLLLGYRTGDGIRFAPPADAAQPLREVVTVLRPEEVEVAGTSGGLRCAFVCHGEVTEVLFGGSVERLRVRLPDDGPAAAMAAHDGTQGSLLEVSRTLPAQREFPVSPGMRVAVGARRIHVLPTPISSFTIVEADAGRAAALRQSPLLATLAARMHTRIEAWDAPRTVPPPGMTVVGCGEGQAGLAWTLLRQRTPQLLCLREDTPVPRRITIFLVDPAARRATFAVAASLLRHLPAEALFLDVHGPGTPEAVHTARMRFLLEVRSQAMAEHGLDLRTELREGDVGREIVRQARSGDAPLLVIGLPDTGAIERRWLEEVLGAPGAPPVLFVQAATGES